MGKFYYNDNLCMQMLWQVSQCLVCAERSVVDLIALFLNSDKLPPFVMI